MYKYDKASLVFNPSAYKAGNIASLKPVDGSGDLTFTRASTATRINEEGIIEEVAANIPRVDFTGGGCGKLLLEPQRTNRLPESNFQSGWTVVSTTVTLNDTTSPDGTTNAAKFKINNAAGQDRILPSPNIASVASRVYTFSVFLKANTFNGSVILRGDSNGNTASAIYNFTTGNVTESGANVISSGKQEYSDGWVRVWVTYTATSTTFYTDITTFNTGTNDDFYFCFANYEEGSYPTSYIPTAGATATRLRDESYTTGLSSIIGQTEGVLNLKFQKYGTLNANRVCSLFTDINNRLGIYTLNNELRVFMISGGVVKIDQTLIASADDGIYNVALAYKVNNVAAYVNGVNMYSNNSVTIPTSLNNFAFENSSEGSVFSHKIFSLLLFTTRLSNTELATLTTI